MEVADTHNFVIQGGVIAHNCADEVRYFCMARPISARVPLPPDTYSQSPAALFLDIPKEHIIATPRAHQSIQILED